eukprot:TRINITY_DN23516_c0_g1_i1.p1 TRINITY_DN23516_c0_g1~~TRINITY_DN23516_c0_g1_i1.p1  ORF type:complete len:470 (+),score=74.34 TRINITY_DN23516_c0_g1_i1:528-1937(+)
MSQPRSPREGGDVNAVSPSMSRSHNATATPGGRPRPPPPIAVLASTVEVDAAGAKPCANSERPAATHHLHVGDLTWSPPDAHASATTTAAAGPPVPMLHVEPSGPPADRGAGALRSSAGGDVGARHSSEALSRDSAFLAGSGSHEKAAAGTDIASAAAVGTPTSMPVCDEGSAAAGGSCDGVLQQVEEAVRAAEGVAGEVCNDNRSEAHRQAGGVRDAECDDDRDHGSDDGASGFDRSLTFRAGGVGATTGDDAPGGGRVVVFETSAPAAYQVGMLVHTPLGDGRIATVDRGTRRVAIAIVGPSPAPAPAPSGHLGKHFRTQPRSAPDKTLRLVWDPAVPSHGVGAAVPKPFSSLAMDEESHAVTVAGGGLGGGAQGASPDVSADVRLPTSFVDRHAFPLAVVTAVAAAILGLVGAACGIGAARAAYQYRRTHLRSSRRRCRECTLCAWAGVVVTAIVAGVTAGLLAGA